MNRTVVRMFGAGLVGGLMSAGIVEYRHLRSAPVGNNVGMMSLAPKTSASDPFPVTGNSLGRYEFADAIEQVSPCVVNISVLQEDSLFGLFGPRAVSESSGSGFILTSDGKIATNAHVVAGASPSGQAQSSVVVTLHDGRSFEGRVTGFDRMSDLALVEIQPGFALSPAKLSTSPLRAGEWVIALGSPLTLKNSATAGIISAVQRDSYELGLAEGGPTAYIQTDAAVSRGNSGGPLISLDGEVIGITTLKTLEADGISFALPIDYARVILEQLMMHGKVRRPFLGVKLLTLTPQLRMQLGGRGRTLPDRLDSSDTRGPDSPIGVLVHEILAGSPADNGGLRPGDVIIAVNGKPVLSSGEFANVIRGQGDTPITCTVLRGRGSQEFDLSIRPTFPSSK